MLSYSPRVPEQRRATVAKEIGVAKLVDGVLQIEPPQEGIGRELCGAQDVAPAVALDLREREQLADSAIEIAPHPAVNRTQQPIEPCSLLNSHRDDT